MTAADELLAIENMDVLRQNGFEVEVDNGEGTHHLKLVAQPVSKDTTFDMKGTKYFKFTVYRVEWIICSQI